ncbi:MAG TPA: hypothetical protein VLM85_02220 [Polyangiaceae bacterium]|nr:hypothetical protein [Polyangiaceae bacterium]
MQACLGMWRAPHLLLFAGAALLTAVPGHGENAPCATSEVEYTLAANLELSDTPLGKGDGVYAIGPGKTVLRFEGKNVKMLSYTMHEHFTVRSKTAFWSTIVTMDANSAATPDACSVAAEGTLEGRRIHWSTPVRQYRTDGTITCSGSFCGQFGAPPPGQSPLHVGPAPQVFSDFIFAPDMKTFTMPKTPGQKTEMPKQTSAVAVSGREVRRTCVNVAPCGK